MSSPDKISKALRNAIRFTHVGQFIVTRCHQIQGSFRPMRPFWLSLTWLLSFLTLDFVLGYFSIKVIGYLWLKYDLKLTVEQVLLESTAYVVSYLNILMTWLMGAPAGLKLNSVLSQSLGKFFLYHIHLWKTFLQVKSKVLIRSIRL